MEHSDSQLIITYSFLINCTCIYLFILNFDLIMYKFPDKLNYISPHVARRKFISTIEEKKR